MLYSFIRNWSIRMKLFSVIGIIATIALVQSVFIIWELSVFTDRAKEVVEEQKFGTELAHLFELDERFSRITHAYIDGGSQLTRNNYFEFRTIYNQRVEAIQQDGFTQDQLARLEKLVMVRAKLFFLEEEAIALKDGGAHDKAILLLQDSRYIEQRDIFSGIIQNEMLNAEEQVNIFASERDNTLRTINLFAYFFLIALVCVGIGLSYGVSSVIEHTAKEMEAVAEAIGRGEVSGRVAVPGKDEIGRIAVAFNKCAVALDATSMKRLKQITKDVGQ